MSVETGSRGIYLADKEASLPYRVYDADHHIYPPPDARIRQLDPKYHARLQQTTGRITPEVEGDDEQHIATTIGTHPVPEGGHGGALADIDWGLERGAKFVNLLVAPA
jgi:hypothetical protein